MNIIRLKQQAQGWHFSCSSAPDMSGANAAALAQAELSKEQLAWAREIYEQTAPDRADATRRANLVSDAQLTALTKQTELTDDYADYNKSTFRPLEQGIVADAANFDSQANQNKAAGMALADVNQGFSSARDQQQRGLSRMGVNPSSGRALALGNQTSIAQAAAQAGAATKARTDTQLQGYARKMDAANMGRGLASSQATSAGVALSQGNSAVASGMQSGNINAQGNQIMNQGFAGAQSGMAGAGQTYLGIANAEQKAGDNSGAIGGLASLGMAAGGMGWKPFSDKNMKTDRKATNSEMSLAAIRNTPVEAWRYKPGSAGDDGGKKHIGPMAQTVQKNFGDKSAPDGKTLDLISLNGHLTNAVKALDKKVMGLDQMLSKIGNSRGKK